MKELKLLAEDYEHKPNVRANLRITPNNDIIYGNLFPHQSGCTYYKAENGQLAEVKPEPRPADSIKLSECKPNHIIIAENDEDNIRKIDYENDLNLWVSRGITGSWECRYKKLEPLVRENEYTNIKIFDMSA